MEIKLQNINLKKGDQNVFDDLNLVIPCKKIIILDGNRVNNFVSLIKDKNFNSGRLIDDNNDLAQVHIVDGDNQFITNVVFDELYLNLKYTDKLKREIVKILDNFVLDFNFFNRQISTLSTLEEKLLRLIIANFSSAKTIVLLNIFDGLDFRHKKLFIKFIKSMKHNKTIFIFDKDIDTLYNLGDYLLVTDDNLNMIEHINKAFKLEELSKVSIRYPNIILFKNKLLEKGLEVDNLDNINDLIREVKQNV